MDAPVFYEMAITSGNDKIKEELRAQKGYLPTVERVGRKNNRQEMMPYELLLYDIADALLDEEILLFDDQRICHASYLVPLLVAYKMAPSFKHFVVVVQDETKISKFKRAINEIAKELHLNIDIHYLEPEEAFLCLERLQKKSKGKGSDYRKIYEECLRKKDKGRRNYWNLTAKKWHKIQVHHCHANTCEFFHRCAYALQYQDIHKDGCTIIRHRDFVSDHDGFNSINPKTNFVVIESAQDLVKAVKRKCEQALNVSLITSYIGCAKSYLLKKGQAFDDHKILLLRDVFGALSEEFEKGPFHITYQTKVKIEILIAFLLELQSDLLQLGINDEEDNTIILKHLKDVTDIFMDMINPEPKYSYYFEPILGNNDILNRFNIIYYPNSVKEIIKPVLAKLNCSVAFVGSNIAGDDNEYRKITGECGLDDIPKTLVKEYTKKDN